MDIVHLRDWAGHILALSQRMLLLAKDQQWQQMLPVEAERRSQIDKLFRHPHMPAALIHVADLLQQVIELDAEGIALGQQARRHMAQELDSTAAARSEVVIRTYNSFRH